MITKYLFRIPFLCAGLFMMASCGGDTAEKNAASKTVEPAAKKPSGQFPFYKDIAIRPGINFEVVSWGKGVDSVGGYLILMTDTLKDDYRSLSNERKGVMVDAWNMDLDNDGNPEIYIELLSKTNVHDLNVYEYSGGSFNKISFPPLSSSLKKNYWGDDKFIIKNGDLFRSFPVVNEKDSTAKPGAFKMLQYKLNGNSFSVKELTE
ncbi:hypothetical protein PBAL39_25065 [Pedobacter sp. BAL39]|uniref:hypothetical protein n=1 Tax=Pedobacter sp. BAL39 TaxID=391596 RepID=UPI000155A02B|nr:hypothetical protein [Pedobacter sp. BAL39]EDM36599.1 hypothetical protein PBAL39_25065 [Pedobacter sp. BAL39]